MVHHPFHRSPRPRSPRRLLPVLTLALSAALLITPRDAVSAPTVWTRLFGTPDYNIARSMAIDTTGNLLVTGGISGTLVGPNGGVSDYTMSFLNKFDQDGELQWMREIGRKASFERVSADDVAVAASGMIYVVGSTNIDTQGQFSFEKSYGIMYAYDSAGTLQWTRQFGSSESTYPISVALDAQGSVYVAGLVKGNLDDQSAVGDYDAFLSKYSPDGTRQWTRQFGTLGMDRAEGVTVDAAGDVYVAGGLSGALDGQSFAGNLDAFVSKFSADGTRQWTRLVGNADTEFATSVAASSAGVPNGGLYMVGWTRASLDQQPHAGESDLFISKFGVDGTRLWTRLLGSTESDYPSDVAVDLAGNVYITGDTVGDLAGQRNAGRSDLLISKFDSSGKTLWTFIYGTEQSDGATSLAVGDQGQLYVAGSTAGALDGQSNRGLLDAFISRVINPTLTPRSFLPLAPR